MATADQLAQAIESVRAAGLDPETPGGAVALEFLLRPAAPPPTSSAESPGPLATPTSVSAESGTGDPLAVLAAWVGVDPERMLDVIEIGSAGVALRLSAARLGNSKANRQRVLTLLKLAADRKAFGVDEVSAQEINSVCADYACVDQNLPNNVAARGDLVTRRGKRGSYVYRVTQPGLERAKEIFEALIAEEGALKL